MSEEIPARVGLVSTRKLHEDFFGILPFLCSAVGLVSQIFHLLLGPQKAVDPCTDRRFLSHWFFCLDKGRGYKYSAVPCMVLYCLADLELGWEKIGKKPAWRGRQDGFYLLCP